MKDNLIVAKRLSIWEEYPSGTTVFIRVMLNEQSESHSIKSGT